MAGADPDDPTVKAAAPDDETVRPDIEDADLAPQDHGSVMREYRRVMMQFSFIGIEFGVAIAIGVLLGRWLDGKWGTAPWMMLVGVAVGLIAAGKDLVKLVRKAKRRAHQRPTQDDAGRSG